ncbi:MAG: hypothetical protein Q8R51_17955 [Azonexus sp.]|nr:hypothetical protein [Azonexus sp.]
MKNKRGHPFIGFCFSFAAPASDITPNWAQWLFSPRQSGKRPGFCIRLIAYEGSAMMSTITFDTLDFTRRLREAGFDERQAEAVVRVMADAQSTLVTREHFDAKMETLETRLDAKIDKLSWMMGILIALAVANFAKQFF